MYKLSHLFNILKELQDGRIDKVVASVGHESVEDGAEEVHVDDVTVEDLVLQFHNSTTHPQRSYRRENRVVL